MQPREIWSGGQTGVDRAGWDAARAAGIAINGWVPRGRLAEDGQVPAGYGTLMQTATADYLERTTANVRDTDATLILCRGSLSGGTAYTYDEAVRLGKPVLTVDLAEGNPESHAARIATWLDSQSGERLNIAGPRESKAPGIHRAAGAVLTRVLVRPGSVARRPGSGTAFSRSFGPPRLAARLLGKSLWEDDPDDPLPERIDVRTSALLVTCFVAVLLADRLPGSWLLLSRGLVAIGVLAGMAGVGRLWYLERRQLRERRGRERLEKDGK